MRLLFALLLLFPLLLSIYYPMDAFASEVLLNKPNVDYDLSKLKDFSFVEYNGNKYVYKSHYSDDLNVQLSLINNVLDVRLQIPSQGDKSTYVEANINDYKCKDMSRANGYNGWECYKLGCRLNEYNVQCDNGLFVAIYYHDSISYDDVAFINNLLNYLGMKPLSKDDFHIVDVDAPKPVVNPYDIDFHKAMKVELNWLIENGIVKGLTEEDVDEISSLSSVGTAGFNYRIVWGKAEGSDKESWVIYSSTGNPVILVRNGNDGNQQNGNESHNVKNVSQEPQPINTGVNESENENGKSILSDMKYGIILGIIVIAIIFGWDFIASKNKSK